MLFRTCMLLLMGLSLLCITPPALGANCNSILSSATQDNNLSPIELQTSLAILRLIRDLPPTFGQSQVAATLFGRSSLTKNRPEWGLLINQKELSQKDVIALYRRLIKDLVEVGAFEFGESVDLDKYWIQRSSYGPELHKKIAELEAQVMLLENPLKELTSETRAKRLTAKEKASIVTAAISIDQIRTEAQKVSDRLEIEGVSSLKTVFEDLDVSAKKKPLKLTQVKSRKQGANSITLFMVDLVGVQTSFIFDGLIKAPWSQHEDPPGPLPWHWNQISLVVQATFSETSGELLKTELQWMPLEQELLGHMKGENRARSLPNMTFDSIFQARELAFAKVLQKMVLSLDKKHLIDLATREVVRQHPDSTWTISNYAPLYSFQTWSFKESQEGVIEAIVQINSVVSRIEFKDTREKLVVRFKIRTDENGDLIEPPKAVVINLL